MFLGQKKNLSVMMIAVSQCHTVYIYICIYKYIFMGQHPHAYTHIYICFFV